MVNLNYNLFIFDFVVTGCGSITAFASLVTFPEGIGISEVVVKAWAITAGIKKYKSIIKKKKNKHDKIVLLAKNTTNVFNDSYISHDEFVLINNVLK